MNLILDCGVEFGDDFLRSIPVTRPTRPLKLFFLIKWLPIWQRLLSEALGGSTRKCGESPQSSIRELLTKFMALENGQIFLFRFLCCLKYLPSQTYGTFLSEVYLESAIYVSFQK
jgi:hypothetical protein